MAEVWIDATAGQGSALTPGTVWADLEVDLSTPRSPAQGGRHPLPALEHWCATLGRWGIGPDTPVRVFDRKGGGLAAARCWWMIRAVGHPDVQLMDAPPPRAPRSAPVSAYPANAWLWPVVDLREAAAHLKDPAVAVLDARSAPRHAGEHEPIDPVAGCLPGSINLPWESLRVQGQWVDDLDTRVRAAIGDADTVVVSCGSGVTACVISAAMDRLGMAPPALYVGSWSEWCRQS